MIVYGVCVQMGNGDTFKKGSVELILLTLLREKDMYGYEMSQAISDRSGGRITMSEGSLYVTLYRMIKEATITDRREIVGKRMRIYYSIEPSGLEKLEKLREEYERMATGIQEFLKTSDEIVDAKK